MQKSLRCKDSRLGFGLLILFGISLVILNFGITRLSALQEPEKDSEIHAALSSLNWPAWLKPGSLRICCLKMYPACYLMTEGGHLRQSSTRWTDWGFSPGARRPATGENGEKPFRYIRPRTRALGEVQGVPQSRNRVYIVGYLDERCRGKVFPFLETAGGSLIQTHGGHQGERVYSPEGLSCTLAANPGGFGGKTGLYEVGVPIKCATKTGYQMAQVGDGIDLSYATVNSRRGRVGKEIAHTLTTGCQQGTVEVRPVKNPIKSDLARNTERTGKPGAPMHTLTTKDRHGVLYEGRIRRLTPRECLRLQGWADDRIDTVLAIQSDNQAYKQAGNGVTVHVVEAIGRRIAAMDAELRGEALAP